MKRSIRWGGAAVAAAVCLVLAACGNAAAGGGDNDQGVTDSEILVGTTLPLTGAAAVAGNDFKAGLQASIDEVNNKGGIHGRKLRLVIYDDGFVTSRSVANVLRLVQQDKVFALDMPVGSAGLPGTFPTVKSSGIPMFGPYLPPDPNLPTVFELATPHSEQGAILADWVKKKGFTTVAYIGQDNDYGSAVLDGLTKEAQKIGLKLVATAKTEANSTNVGPAVLTAKQADPQALVLGTDGVQASLVLKQAQQLGWKPTIIGESSAANTGTTSAVGPAGAAANGFYGAATAALPTGDTPQVKAYRAAMQATAPDHVDALNALIAYGTNQVFFHILDQMGDDLSWKNFVAKTEALKDFDTGLLPPITFGPLPGGHTGAHSVLVAQYENGKWTVTDPYTSTQQ
ncbi:ABC transporter substrate-binding protein [Pseudonocardia sp. GCM10023141]|uniref:ABC transporter substrate-binding protein n=1 Tax=Pseudonocardia sp. GCM10023141 TaxID=3252653 RepID=UPI0036210E78